MRELGHTLAESIDCQTEAIGTDSDREELARISSSLRGGVSLEEALSSDHSNEIRDFIRRNVCDQIEAAERQALKEIALHPEDSTYARLMGKALEVNQVLNVVTTNYDRLIEALASLAGLRIDSMFSGQTVGILSDVRAGQEQATLRRRNTGSTRSRRALVAAKHLRLAKPHGSLDWREIDGRVFRSDLLRGVPHIIAPTKGKYREGYGVGFQEHIARAAQAVSEASAFLFVGFGFNDDHLQTHLASRLRAVPSVVLAHTLTSSARHYLAESPPMLAIESSGAGPTGALVHFGEESFTTKEDLWELDELLTHVLSAPRRNA
ncbi:MAG: SIR2 family protein [Microcella pacifica]